MLIQYYNSVEENQAEGREFQKIRGFASKAAEQTLRLAGILQLFEDESAQTLSLAHLTCAIELMDWYLSESKRLFEATSVPEPLQKAEKLRRWLFEKWTECFVDIRSIVRFGPNFTRNASSARELVQMLEKITGSFVRMVLN
nr:DUF3987 domain-containing protein [Pelagimonas phthalicica]